MFKFFLVEGNDFKLESKKLFPETFNLGAKILSLYVLKKQFVVLYFLAAFIDVWDLNFILKLVFLDGLYD